MLPSPFLAGAPLAFPIPGEGVDVEPGHAHKESKSINSSVPEEPGSERLGSTVFVRSKSPENESSRGTDAGPKLALSIGFATVLEAGTGVSEGAEVAQGSGTIGGGADSNGAGVF